MKVRVKKDVLGDDDEQTVFGKTAEAGEWIEVDDRFADKAKGNPTLEVQGARASRQSSEDTAKETAAAREAAAEKAAADETARGVTPAPRSTIGTRT